MKACGSFVRDHRVRAGTGAVVQAQAGFGEFEVQLSLIFHGEPALRLRDLQILEGFGKLVRCNPNRRYVYADGANQCRVVRLERDV